MLHKIKNIKATNCSSIAPTKKNCSSIAGPQNGGQPGTTKLVEVRTKLASLLTQEIAGVTIRAISHECQTVTETHSRILYQIKGKKKV
jgi:hypothetical protein